MAGLPGTRRAPDLPPGPRAALVIATASYQDSALSQLRATADDAQALTDVLGDPSIGGFVVTPVIDADERRARRMIDLFLSGRDPGDVVLVYLSCHGVLDRRNRLYFAAADTVKDHLSATGIPAAWLLEQLEECRARQQVVILDCCFSGAFANGSKGDSELDLERRLSGSGRGRAVLTASRAGEYSFTGDALSGATVSGSLFTAGLVEGLRTGAADTGGDGYITVDEAYDFVYHYVLSLGAAQTPQRWLSGGEGAIVLARSPAGIAIKPAMLSEELADALESRYPTIRIGAIHELGNWLAGDDPARALTAEQKLRQIADNDNHTVATAARAYLAAPGQAVITHASASTADPDGPSGTQPTDRRHWASGSDVRERALVLGAARMSTYGPASRQGATTNHVTVEAQWALRGKTWGRDGYRVLACSTGRLNSESFTEAIDRFSMGTPETHPQALPQVTISYLPTREVNYLALATHRFVSEDQTQDGHLLAHDDDNRPVVVTSYYCVAYDPVARHGVSYRAMYEAFAAAPLHPENGPVLPVNLPLPPDPPAASDDAPAIDPLTAVTAALLISGRPVCVLGASGTSMLERLTFIDAVMALLPYGFRAKMSAATWTRATNQNHRFRLFFSGARRDVREPDHVVFWGQSDLLALTADHDIARWYLQWLNDGPVGRKLSLLAGSKKPRSLAAKDEVLDALDEIASRNLSSRGAGLSRKAKTGQDQRQKDSPDGAGPTGDAGAPAREPDRGKMRPPAADDAVTDAVSDVGAGDDQPRVPVLALTASVYSPPTPRPSPPSTVDAPTWSLRDSLSRESGPSSQVGRGLIGHWSRVLRLLMREPDRAPDEAHQAEAERRRAAEAEVRAATVRARERWLADRKPEEKRLMPLTWAVRGAAWFLSLATCILCICSAFNWEPRIWLYLLIPGLLLSFLPAVQAYEVKFTNGARGGPALAALFMADAGSVLFASRVLITFVPALIVVAAWGIATYHLSAEETEYNDNLEQASKLQS